MIEQLKGRDEHELDEADRVVLRVYERSKRPIPWDESDETIMAMARRSAAAGLAGAERRREVTSEDRKGAETSGEGATVVPFRRRILDVQVFRSPTTAMALAASLLLGVFVGQGVISYVNFGVGPDVADIRNATDLASDYQAAMQENERLAEALRSIGDIPMGTVIEEPETTPAVAGVAAGANLTALARALGGFDCASLRATLSPSLELDVAGHVASAEDLAQLESQLAPFAGTAAVATHVVVLGWPNCRAAEVLTEHAGGRGGQALPRIAPQAHGADYVAGEMLAVTATATGAFDGYLYVDRLLPDGTVHHLLPSVGSPDNAVVAGETVMLEGDDAGYSVAAPYGTDMLMVFSSPRPLFDSARPASEPAEPYLADLRRALQTQGADEAVGTYTLLNTRDR